MPFFRSPAARALRSFLSNSSGVAAIEFAFIAPVALGLLSLGVAGGQTLTMNHKVVLAAHSVTDLVSRTAFVPDTNTNFAELLNESDLQSDLALAAMILYPKDTTNLTIVMTMLQVNGNTNQGTVVWSEGFNGGVALQTSSPPITLDPSYIATGAKYLIYGQVSYTFQPLGGILALPSITLNSTEIMTIRNAQQITLVVGS